MLIEKLFYFVKKVEKKKEARAFVKKQNKVCTWFFRSSVLTLTFVGGTGLDLAPVGHLSLWGDLGLWGRAEECCLHWELQAGSRQRQRMPALARFPADRPGYI